MNNIQDSINKAIELATNNKFHFGDEVIGVKNVLHYVDISKVPQTVIDECLTKYPDYFVKQEGNSLHLESYARVKATIVGITYMFVKNNELPNLDIQMDGVGEACPIKNVESFGIFKDYQDDSNKVYNEIMDILKKFI